jgi:flagellar FliJ protein
MPAKLPLDTLTELARGRSDDAARRLAALLQAQASASQKLELLLQYREDYSQQLRTRMLAGSMPLSQWRNYQDFLATLDAGIAQQRAVAIQAESRLDDGRSDWRHERQRLNAYDTLGERIQRQEQAQLARREQRDTDERAARKVFDRTTSAL